MRMLDRFGYSVSPFLPFQGSFVLGLRWHGKSINTISWFVKTLVSNVIFKTSAKCTFFIWWLFALVKRIWFNGRIVFLCVCAFSCGVRGAFIVVVWEKIQIVERYAWNVKWAKHGMKRRLNAKSVIYEWLVNGTRVEVWIYVGSWMRKCVCLPML